MAVGRSPKIAQLKVGTHRGRPTRTKSSVTRYNKTAARGIRATGIRADPRLTTAAMTKITPTPSGPEPGHGGLTY